MRIIDMVINKMEIGGAFVIVGFMAVEEIFVFLWESMLEYLASLVQTFMR
jgi:hypothetical protein